MCSSTISWPIGTTLPIVTVVANPSPGSGACVAREAGGCPAGVYAPEVTFQAEADGGETFEWEASFALFREPVSVTRSGAGSGVVTGMPAPHTTSLPASGINCGSQCTASYDDHQPMSLTATPSAGSVFTQWTGACAGQGATCTLNPTATTSTNAVFGLASQTTTTTTTTTTTPTTTTTHSTTPTSTAATTPAVHQGLQAQLIGVKSGKSRLGFRVEEIEIQAADTVTAKLALTRVGKRLAHATIRGISIGDRILTFPIPGPVKKGEATLTVTLSDSAGNHHTWTRTVAIPS